MQRVRDRKEDTYRCQVCDMECVSKKMAQSAVPVTKSGNYGDNATPTPTAYVDEFYVAITVSFTAESGSDPAYLTDSALGFADNDIQCNWAHPEALLLALPDHARCSRKLSISQVWAAPHIWQ